MTGQNCMSWPPHMLPKMQVSTAMHLSWWELGVYTDNFVLEVSNLSWQPSAFEKPFPHPCSSNQLQVVRPGYELSMSTQIRQGWHAATQALSVTLDLWSMKTPSSYTGKMWEEEQNHQKMTMKWEPFLCHFHQALLLENYLLPGVSNDPCKENEFQAFASSLKALF